MENRQLKNLGIILILPILFAGFGYFGMKIFLAGSGPKTVMPEEKTTSIISDSKDDSVRQSESGQSSNAETQSESTSTKTENTKSESQNKSQSVEDKSSSQASDQAETKNTGVAAAPSESVQETKPVSTYTFNSIDFFSLQVGSYSSLSNAQKHVESLKEEGINAYVFHGKNYKVMAGLNATRDGVEVLKEHVAATIPDAFVKGLMIVPDVLKYPEDGQASESFDQIVKAYKNRLNQHIQFLSEIQGKSNEEISIYLNEDLKSMEKIISSIDGFNGDESFKSVLANLKNIMNVTDQKVRQKINAQMNGTQVFTLYIEEIMSYNKMN